MIKHFFKAALAGIAISQSTLADKQPNILFIVIDDAGYDDFSYAGCKDWKTPHIDSIAKNGTTFTNGYVTASVCGPSRAGLLTGRYQQSFGHEENITGGQAWKVPSEKFGLPTEIPTLGTLLQKKGYTTAVFGKWHLGEHENFHPNNRGFDHFVGFLGGSRSFWPLDKASHGHKLRINDTVIKSPEYLTDYLGKATAEFITQNKEKPFFAYLAYNAVHSPLHAKENDLQSLSHIDHNGRKLLGAMTVALDQSIGLVLDTLKKHNLEENTLIVFSNDNGAATYLKTDNGGLRGRKGTVWEGGLKVPFLVQWKGHIPANTTCSQPVNLLDAGSTFCKLAGYNAPAELDLPGTNLVSLANGKTIQRNLYWKRGNTSAIRNGQWKLITLKDKPTFLFDLNADPKETNNLLKQEDSIANKLDSSLKQWEATLPAPLWKKKVADQYDTFLMKYWD
ncbi:sulfatase [Rubritalea tangerina]|uniref:Sulfatase n=1 Tax=Rubritalea tangerina TaxID=430798 RepID=A0ABW4ZEC3_9BACT